MNNQTHRFGLTNFGATRRPALPLAFPLGVIGALALGALAAFVLDNHLSLWANLAIYTLCLTPVTTMLAWITIVDRATIPGAVKNPEHSVESTWSLQASSIAFYTLMTLVSLALFITTIAGYVTASNTLLAVLITMAVCYGISYLIVKNR